MPEHGRTLWDLICENKKAVAIIVTAIASVAVGYWLMKDYPDETIGFIEEYWPVAMAPLLGWFLGKSAVSRLYQANRRVIFTMDVATHTVHFISIPEKIFETMQQSGNNVIYHTVYGTPVYIANKVDMRTGEIDYGWVHELDAAIVMTREDAYVKWDDTLTQVLEENIELMSHPHIIGLGYARKALKDHLDGIGQELGLTESDLEPMEENREQEIKSEEVKEGDDVYV